mmetsp:Transcript_32850/g.48441  ORF Transcript_32850/g.48441 Transcript_32850/m.48441 type:complete len:343 (+) Transcript_32850:130-1158(+)
MANYRIGLNLLQANAINVSASTHRPPIIYLYKGGPVPRYVTHIRIHKSIKVIPDELFSGSNVQVVEMHDGVYKIGKLAFYNCPSLERISSATGVRLIDEGAFYRCRRLKDVEFGSEKLERIGVGAFTRCGSLRGLKLPSVKIVDSHAFQFCINMTDVEFGEGLERMDESALLNCYSLRRVAMPLREDLISDNIFKGCTNMASVELVGEVHNTISHFSLQVWKDVMKYEINLINQVLPAVPADGNRTLAVRQWIRRVRTRVEHFTKEHNSALEESATILELSLWRDNLNGETNHCSDSSLNLEAKPNKRARIDVDSDSARQERRMTCGANIVVKNVLPFLQLK